MGFTPRVVLNASKGVTQDVRDLVNTLKSVKVTAHRSGHWMDLKLEDGKPLTFLGPVVEVRRGASATITEVIGGEKKEKPTKPTILLYLVKGDAGSNSLGEFLGLVDERVKQLCVDKIKELETKAKNQNAEYVADEFKAWDSRAKKSFANRHQALEADEGDAPIWIRCKIMVRKDSDDQNPANWLVGVKELDDTGSIKKYGDATELKGGNFKVQPSLEISSMMKSNQGFCVDVQVRELLIVERMAGDTPEHDAANALADPTIEAMMMAKRKAAACAKKEADTKKQKTAAPVVEAPPPSALYDSDEEDVPVAPAASKHKKTAYLSDDDA